MEKKKQVERPKKKEIKKKLQWHFSPRFKKDKLILNENNGCKVRDKCKNKGVSVIYAICGPKINKSKFS